MRQYVQTDPEVRRQAATALAALILSGVVSALEYPRCEATTLFRPSESPAAGGCDPAKNPAR
jgi:hypothetical protein